MRLPELLLFGVVYFLHRFAYGMLYRIPAYAAEAQQRPYGHRYVGHHKQREGKGVKYLVQRGTFYVLPLRYGGNKPYYIYKPVAFKQRSAGAHKRNGQQLRAVYRQPARL